jgi:S-methylmethionine-dependent homocysteine/selenocysteine methylase
MEAEYNRREERQRMVGGLAQPGSRLADRVAEGPPLVLDGATGTELERLGIRATLPLWSAHALLEAPQAVLQVHRAYVQAGADLLTANSFRTQERTLARGHLGARARELTAFAVDLARRALAGSERPVWVLGSAPPLEDCFRPDLVPADDALAREHGAHAANLVAAGVDAILAETHHTVREAVAAARAAREAGSEVLVSFVCDGAAQLLSGEPLADAVEALTPLGPLALGVNCLAPDAVEPCLPLLRDCGLPFLVYANLGAPPAEGGFVARDADTTPEAFAEHARRWYEAGARIVGGCCGTTAEHIECVAEVRTRCAAER